MRVPSTLSRLRALALAGAVAALLAPGAAQAATVGAGSGVVTYTAATGEPNQVSVTPWGRALRIADSGANLTAGNGCWQLSAHSAACFGSSLGADLGDGADDFDASASAVPAAIAARDGEVDTLACGAGSDSVVADSTDVISGCESVELPPVAEEQVPESSSDEGGTTDPAVPAVPTVPAVPGPGPGAGILPAAPANSAPPTVPEQTVAISPDGVASVRVYCPADSGGCRGTVALEQVQGAAVAATASKRRKATVLGQAKFTAKAGTSPTVKVRLSKRGRQRILRGRRGRSRYRVKVTTRSADGKSVVTTQEVTLRARRGAARGAKGRKK